MNKIDWVRKFTSRKLWLAVAAFVSGLIVAFGGEKTTAETVAGCILQGAAVLGYVLAEGLRDANAAEALGEERRVEPDRMTFRTEMLEAKLREAEASARKGGGTDDA